MAKRRHSSRSASSSPRWEQRFGVWVQNADAVGQSALMAGEEGAAQEKLIKLQAENGPKSHFYDRHGAQTTLEQQKERSKTGRNPGEEGPLKADGTFRRPESGLRFYSHQGMLNAYDEAQAELKKNKTIKPGDSFPIKMDDRIGEGYNVGSGDRFYTDTVTVQLDQNKKIITMYPDIKRHGKKVEL